MSEIIKLRSPQNRFKEGDRAVERDGTRLEKGVQITEDFMERNYNSLCHYWQEIAAYPDV